MREQQDIIETPTPEEQRMDTAAQILDVVGQVDTPIFFLKALGNNACATDGSYSYASTVAFSTSIYLHPIPKFAFNSARDKIEEILVHESIHITLYQLGLEDESVKFDKLFGCLGALTDLGIDFYSSDKHQAETEK